MFEESIDAAAPRVMTVDGDGDEDEDDDVDVIWLDCCFPWMINKFNLAEQYEAILSCRDSLTDLVYFLPDNLFILESE